jgi:hypothetical protein
MNIEEFLARESADPDDLAAVTCVMLRRAGMIPIVRLRLEEVGEEEMATAIEVLEGARLVASFPIQPMKIGKNDGGLLHAVNAISYVT